MPDQLVSDNLVKANEYAKTIGLDHHLQLVENFPPWLENASRYILERGKGELPQTQFDGTTDPKNQSDFVEVIGIVSYDDNNGLVDIARGNPQSSIVHMEGEEWIGTTSPILLIDPFEIPNENIHFMEYHSHPLGVGELSPGDARSIEKYKNLFKMVKVYGTEIKTHFYGILVPPLEQVVWYEILPN